MDSDYYLASGSGEPPRKRRAAAMAAQKNWQMLNKDEDIIDLDDDLVEVTQTVQRSPLTTVTPYASLPPKRSSVAGSTSIIDLNRYKKAADRDYSPTEDLLQQVHGMKARKSFPTPTIPTAPQMVRVRTPIILSRNSPQLIQNRIQTLPPTRIRGPAVRPPPAVRIPTGIRTPTAFRTPAVAKPLTVLIETENSTRIITRNDGSQPRKDVIKKNHPSEPENFPIVEGETQEIVGTYNDDEEIIVPNDNDWIDELSLILHCESENKTLKSSKENQESKDDDIEVIEVINGREVVNQSGPQRTPTPRNTINSQKSRQNKVKGHLEPIIDTLEMDCENFDDEHTDGIWIDCEEDILSESQWKQSEDAIKTYNKYKKAVSSTKNVKFLPEAECQEPIGMITTTVSETTRVITKPVVSKPVVHKTSGRLNTRQNTVPSQSIRAPTPSVPNSLPTQIPPNFTILPIASTSGVTNPLILAPTSFVGSPGAALPSGLRLILQPRAAGTPQYVMLSQQSPAVVPTQSIIVSNGNPIYHQNLLATSGQHIRLSSALTTTLRPRIIGNQLQTAIRAPVAAVRGRPPIYRVSSQASPTINLTNRPSINQLQNQLFDCLTNFKSAPNANKKINMTTVLTIKPLPFSWPSNIDDLINSLIKLG